MDSDIQEKRYQHYENKRLEKISKASERRKDIIANPDKIFSKVKSSDKSFLIKLQILKS
jgi:hypothetical protein